MNVRARLANLAWMAAARAEHGRFRRALDDPAGTQRALLARFLAENAGCDYGRRHGFGKLRGPEDFRRAVPAVAYDDLRPEIARVADGGERRGVLSTAPVRMFEPTGGSTSAAGGSKLIPYPDALRAGFGRAVGAWMFDLLRHTPGMAGGPQHWFITPSGRGVGKRTPGGVPVGFETDADYLGPLERMLAGWLFPVPRVVGRLPDLDNAFYTTLRFLFQTPGLRFISAWHPSLLVLLVRRMREWRPFLLRDLARGTLTHPEPDAVVRPGLLRRGLRAMPARARRLEERGEALAPADLWPELRLISCWTDAAAAVSVPELRETFPGVPVQGKGLLATEGVVTIPLRECEGVGCPVALRSGFFEFLEDDDAPADRARGTHELEAGGEYSVLLTNGGGLWRYRLGDRVRVTGRVGRTPLLRFVGKSDGVSDLRGEKLAPAVVGKILGQLLGTETSVRFAMLAPVTTAEPPRYALFLDMDGEPPAGLAWKLDDALAANPHYAFCRQAGQLGPTTVFRVRRGTGQAAYLARARADGRRAGDVKPTALSPRDGWETRFAGMTNDE